jgi:putative transcriptional regulator
MSDTQNHDSGSERRQPSKTVAQLIGRRIREIRAEREWSQRDLAALLGLSSSRLNKYENGLHEPPVRLLVRMAQILEVPLDLLAMPEPPQFPIGDADVLARVRRLLGLPGVDKRAVVALLDVILGFFGFVQGARGGEGGPR